MLSGRKVKDDVLKGITENYTSVMKKSIKRLEKKKYGVFCFASGVKQVPLFPDSLLPSSFLSSSQMMNTRMNLSSPVSLRHNFHASCDAENIPQKL